MAAHSSAPPPLYIVAICASEKKVNDLLPFFSEANTPAQLSWVETSSALRQALRRQPCDAALYIPELVSFPIHSVVHVIDDLGFDIPLIVVADPQDRCNTQRSMQAGARDVIDTDHIERLAPAIAREIGEARHRADHRAALEMLKESEARFRALASNLPGMLFQLRRDAQGDFRFLYVSEGCQKLLGFKQQELLASATRLFEAFDAPQRLSLENALSESADKGSLLSWEGRLLDTQNAHWVNLRSTPLHFDSGVVEWLGIATNISESKQNEFALRDSHRRLAELTAHLEVIKEEERERISRDIHDELSSILVCIKIEASQMISKLSDIDDKLCDKARIIENLLDRAMGTANRVVRELRPGILNEFGLSAAIESQAEDFSQRFGIPCRVLCDDDIGKLEPDTSLTLFRITQEALTNIAKHANAAHVMVRLRRENGNIALEIKDDGCGISEEDMRKPKSFGLRGIRERVLSLKGEFSIAQAENGGTLISLHVPERTGVENPDE